MSAHSEIGASGSYRWSVCPGSVGFIRRNKIPNITTEAAAEGTAAHELAADSIINTYDPAKRLGDIIKVTCDTTKRVFEIEVTQEMVDAVNLYRRTITEMAEELAAPNAPPTLCVLDLKYGAGVVVNVKDNKQLKQYALGALISKKQGVEVGFDMSQVHPLMFGTADFVFANYRIDQMDPDYIRYGIVQPRADHPDGPVRFDTIHATDLIMYSADLKAAAEATDDPNAPLVPGRPQCDWCPAAASCPALQAYRKKAATLLPWPKHDVVPKVSDVKPSFTNYTPEQLGEAMRISELGKVAIAALHEHAYQVAVQGVQIPGYKLVQKQPRRKWNSPTTDYDVERRVMDVVKARGLSIQTHEQPKLRSPAQLEDSIKEATPLTKGSKDEKAANKRLRESMIEDLKQHYKSESSGLVLVPDEDKRDQVKLLKATEIFQPVVKLPPINTANQEEK